MGNEKKPGDKAKFLINEKTRLKREYVFPQDNKIANAVKMKEKSQQKEKILKMLLSEEKVKVTSKKNSSLYHRKSIKFFWCCLRFLLSISQLRASIFSLISSSLRIISSASSWVKV